MATTHSKKDQIIYHLIKITTIKESVERMMSVELPRRGISRCMRKLGVHNFAFLSPMHLECIFGNALPNSQVQGASACKSDAFIHTKEL